MLWYDLITKQYFFAFIDGPIYWVNDRSLYYKRIQRVPIYFPEDDHPDVFHSWDVWHGAKNIGKHLTSVSILLRFIIYVFVTYIVIILIPWIHSSLISHYNCV